MDKPVFKQRLRVPRGRWTLFQPKGESTSYTSMVFRTIILAFLFPLVTGLVVILCLDYFSDNDLFAVSAVRSFESDYESKAISNVELVVFDRNFTHENSFPESRKDIFDLAELLVESGAKLVVLDYRFNYSDDTFPISESLRNKLLVGSQIIVQGMDKIEVTPPQHLLPSNIIMGNWGDLSLYDTEDRYGAINSLVYYPTANNAAVPSLALATFNHTYNKGSNQQLRNNDFGLPKTIIENERYWLLIPKNLSKLPARSAWRIRVPLEKGMIDMAGKTVFVATTWDINQDHFYIGSKSTDTFFKRVMSWSGLSKHSTYDGKLPGIYAHISAYLNLIDGHHYLHVASNIDESYRLIAYGGYFTVGGLMLLVFWLLGRYVRERQYGQPILLLVSLCAFLCLVLFTFFYAQKAFSEFGLSLSLTSFLLIKLLILILFTAKELDNERVQSELSLFEKLPNYRVIAFSTTEDSSCRAKY